MRSKLFAPLLFAVIALTTASNLHNSNKSAESLARQAISENATESKAAIITLRSMGAEGLNALFDVYASDIKRFVETGEQTAQWTKIATALDTVAMQKDAYAARLYWHTDFDKAKEEALKSKKPILTLRLLGNLNEEFSCANSRFFRTVLYANEDVSKILRERFVLHWKSVRPAPRVTIDFGDGRKIERTITGNSVHYILDSNGRPLDALAGLNGPAAFKNWLLQIEGLATQIKGQDEGGRMIALELFHRARINAITNAWSTDLEKSGVKLPPQIAAKRDKGKNPTAIEAAPLAVTKRAVEIDILKVITADATALETNTNLDDWKKIAALHANEARLDKNSIALIHRQTLKNNPKSDEQLSRIINNFEGYIALDTVRNEYMMHTKLHAWFITGEGNDLERLNEKVYSELFLTPNSDPWLGLYSPDTYTAIEGGGIIK